MRPRVHYLMGLLVLGASFATVAYICGGNPMMGILAVLFLVVFGILLIFQIKRIWEERKR